MPITRDEALKGLGLLKVARLAKAPESDRDALAVADLFVACFADWTPALWEAAIIAYLNDGRPECRFWPTPGQLRAALPEVSALSADEVWPHVLACMSGQGDVLVPGTGPLRWIQAHELFRDKLERRVGRPAMEQAFAALGGGEGYRQLARADTSTHMAARASFRAAWGGGVERRRQGQIAEQVGRVLGTSVLRLELPPPPRNRMEAWEPDDDEEDGGKVLGMAARRGADL